MKSFYNGRTLLLLGSIPDDDGADEVFPKTVVNAEMCIAKELYTIVNRRRAHLIDPTRLHNNTLYKFVVSYPK